MAQPTVFLSLTVIDPLLTPHPRPDSAARNLPERHAKYKHSPDAGRCLAIPSLNEQQLEGSTGSEAFALHMFDLCSYVHMSDP